MTEDMPEDRQQPPYRVTTRADEPEDRQQPLRVAASEQRSPVLPVISSQEMAAAAETERKRQKWASLVHLCRELNDLGPLDFDKLVEALRPYDMQVETILEARERLTKALAAAEQSEARREQEWTGRGRLAGLH